MIPRHKKKQGALTTKYGLFAGTVYRHNIKGTGSNISATRYAANKRSRNKYCIGLVNRKPYLYGETMEVGKEKL